MRTLFVDVKGGLGYNVSLIRVINAITSKSKDIEFRVCSPYWDLFAAAGIDYYKPNEIRDFIFDAKECKGEIIEHRIYDMSEFIYKELNYKDAWLKLFGLPSDYISDADYEHYLLEPIKVAPNVNEQMAEVMKNIPTEKFMLVQFCGGQSPLVQPINNDWAQTPYNYEDEPLKRHYPTEKAQELVSKILGEHKDVTIIQYALPNEPLLDGCLHLLLPYLDYYLLSLDPRCIGAVTIDSSLAHLITGNTKVMTIWGHSLPENFGYKCNKHIVQDCRRDDILYFTALGPSGAKVKYIEPDKLYKKIEDYFFKKDENNVLKKENL